MENTSNFDLVESNLVGSNESYEFTFFVDIYTVQPCDAMEFMLSMNRILNGVALGFVGIWTLSNGKFTVQYITHEKSEQVEFQRIKELILIWAQKFSNIKDKRN